MIGTAFSMAVRRCAWAGFGTRNTHERLLNVMSSRLGLRENLKLNIASLLKWRFNPNQGGEIAQDIVSMVKAKLPEFYSLDASRKGRKFPDYRLAQIGASRWPCECLEINLNRVTRSNKAGNGIPKETAGSVWELRDCLKRSVYGLHGSRGFVLRSYDRRKPVSEFLNVTSEYLGVRGYATENKPEGNLPRKFKRLMVTCEKLPNIRITDPIYNILYDRKIYEMAYHNIKSKPGNMTPGILPETLDEISLEWIDETIQKLKDESFQFRPGKRIQIPKSNGGKRPLTIAPPRDKIIQEAIRMILTAIYEPTFSPNSHGFRPGKSCHTALRQVKTQFGSASWYIEGDISKCFDSFDHHTLMRMIEEKISDRRFTNLIWKTLRAGYFEFGRYQHSIIGTPQGSVISPILANVYLDPFDKFIEQIQTVYHKGKEAKKNPEWRRLEHLRGKAVKAGDNLSARKILREMQTHPSRLANDPNFRRLYYVRYADDWIIAIRGPRTEVIDILEKIKTFLENELKLTLSETKTIITNPRTDNALFLGTNISISKHKYYTRRPKGVKVRAASQIRMIAPMDKIYKKLKSAGFILPDKKEGAPKFLWLHNSKDEIIKLYNAILRGYLNYYSFTMNYGKMAASLRFLLFTSCAKLLAAKFNLNTVKKVITKFGPDLKGSSEIGFLKPKLKLNPWEFKMGVKTYISALYSSGLSAASLENLNCNSCGSTYRVEMHHVRMLKDLNPKISQIDRIMVKKRRKQIPLCRKCHLEHHRRF